MSAPTRECLRRVFLRISLARFTVRCVNLTVTPKLPVNPSVSVNGVPLLEHALSKADGAQPAPVTHHPRLARPTWAEFGLLILRPAHAAMVSRPKSH